MKKLLKRFTAVLLSTTTALCGVQFPQNRNNFKAVAEESDPNPTVISGVTFEAEKSLRDVGMGSYVMTVEMAAVNKLLLINEKQNITDAYHFTAPYNGEYIVDLWGGDGASTDNAKFLGVNEAGGDGGKGGHVYGKLELKQGQTLVITLGGKGKLTVTEEGGGANGDGGAHGDRGSYEVGAGGGYSAVFLFEKDEFERKYMTDGVPSYSLTQQDIEDKFIMVAGGGGGAGAHPGLFEGLNQNFGSWIFGREKQQPDGGNAGTMESGKSPSCRVANGTCFYGEDGKFIGKTSDYSGIKGSYVPGTPVDIDPVHLFKVNASEGGNNWYCTEYPDREPGSGGSGNLRGGGGGAGYCGGSGGNMDRLTKPTNVGGGGGGSSYVDDFVKIVSDSEITKENPSGKSGQGSCTITMLSTSYDTNVNLSSTFMFRKSSYFDCIGAKIDGTKLDLTLNENTYTVSGVGLEKTTSKNGTPEKTTKVELTFKPIEGFAGGNNVPVIVEKSDMVVHPSNTSKTFTVEPNKEADYANVPWQKRITTYSVAVKKGEKTAVTNLFKAELPYEGEDKDTLYGFVKILQNGEQIYSVNDENGEISLTDSVGAGDYTVSYKVSPNNDELALVGKPIEKKKEISGVANVYESNADAVRLKGAGLQVEKELSYDGTNYNFSVNVTADKNGNENLTSNYDKYGTLSNQLVPDDRFNVEMVSYLWAYEGTNVVPKRNNITIPVNELTFHYVNPETKSVYQDFEVTYKVPRSGFYFISAFGADGGFGASVLLSKGGTGGKGENKYGYVWLAKDTELKITVGNGGAGGDYTFGDIITGLFTSGSTGLRGGNCKVQYAGNDDIILEAVAGKGGKNGYPTHKGENGTGGIFNNSNSNNMILYEPTGVNLSTYMNSEFSKSNTPYDPAINDRNLPYAGSGAVYIVPMIMTEVEIDIPYSKYFNVSDEKIAVENHVAKTSVDIPFEVYVINSNNSSYYYYLNVANLKNGTKESTTVPFTPIPNFLGGNDVPLLDLAHDENVTIADAGRISGDTSVKQYKMDYNGITDRANVELALPNLVMNTYDQEYTKGSEPGIPLERTGGKGLFDYVGYGEFEEYNPETDSNGKDDSTPENDFVVAGEVQYLYENGESVKPDKTTKYTKKVSVKPAKTEGVEAKVIEVQSEKLFDNSAVVTVNYSVTGGELSRLSLENNETIVGKGERCTVRLVPESGYLLPDSVTLNMGGTALKANVDYSYSSKTGEIVIFKDVITDNVTVDGTAKTRAYTVTFFYDSSPFGDEVSSKSSELYPDDDMPDPSDVDYADSYEARTKDGKTYVFTWDYGKYSGENGAMHVEKMPANNVDVIGSWSRKTSTIKVKFESADSDFKYTGKNPLVIENYIGETLEIIPPMVNGYIFDHFIDGADKKEDSVLTTTFGENEKVIEVWYRKNVGNQIQIFYIDTAGSLISTPYLENSQISANPVAKAVFDEGTDAPSELKSDKADYPDTYNLKEVKPDANFKTVIYKKQGVELVYHDSGGSQKVLGSKTVYVGDAISYDAESGIYKALLDPTTLPPSTFDASLNRQQCTFLGWTFDEQKENITDKEAADKFRDRSVADVTHPIAGDTIVTSDMVDNNNQIHLYANWYCPTYRLEIEYLYGDNVGSSSGSQIGTFKGNYAYGTKITDDFEIPTVEGCTANQTDLNKVNKLQGSIMPAGDVILKVYYMANKYKLTIKYVAEVANTNQEIKDSDTKDIYFNNVYKIDAPYIEGYLPENSVQTFTAGAENAEIIFKYVASSEASYVITVPSLLTIGEENKGTEKVRIMGSTGGSTISVSVKEPSIDMVMFNDSSTTQKASVKMGSLSLNGSGSKETNIEAKWEEGVPLIGTWEGYITYTVTQTAS